MTNDVGLSGNRLNDLDSDSLRAHLAAIVDSSDDAILSKTLDGTILSWNGAAEKLYGYSAEEIVGKPITVIVPPDRPGEVEGLLARIKQGKAIDHFETLRIRKDGTTLPVSLTISPIKDGDGNIIAASTIARDIRDRKEADELRFRLAAIVDSSDDAILSKTLDGIILSWNRAAEKLYGYSAEEIVGKPITVIVPPDRPGEVEGLLARIKQGKAIDHFETLRIRKDGTTLPVSLTISPIKDGDGNIIAASTIARDISERRRLEREVEAALHQALEASRFKSDFLATMSHEIRTPMNGVIGMAGMLLDTELDPRQREYAETVRTSGETLLTIINDILDFSKIEAGKLELEVIDFNLRAVIEEVADLLAESAHAKELELATVVRPDVPTAVRGDPGRLRQILTNLVGNAIKFTGTGEVVIRAGIEDEDAAEIVVRIEVIDTGIGIAPGKLSRLFQAFSQADSSTTRTYGGTGLGLAISKQLVELMGGDIEVDSEPGRGSNFAFTARLAKQPAQGVTDPMKRLHLKGLRVLIVDDNHTNRTILEHQVTSWGMRSATAAGAATALDILRDAAANGEPFDIGLLDMEMPDVDGLGLAHAIRSDPTIASIPLVLLTSSGMKGSAESARRAGFAAYLTKPVRQSQLYECIATVMGTAPDAPRRARLITRYTLSEAKAQSRPRLLVAEDNQVNQKVAAAMLTRIGYRADFVANGAEAVEALSRVPYGAILMDCQMPEMDGYQATMEIRKRQSEESRIPIIAMTAGVMEGDRERCLAAGMDDYISKPVLLDDLATVLGRWVPSGGDRSGVGEAEEAEKLDADPPLDPQMVAQLRALGGDNGSDAFTELVDLFLEESSARLEVLRAAIVAADIDRLKGELHTLKGASGTVGAARLADRCRELEELLLSNDPNLGPAALDPLEAEFHRVEAALAKAVAGDDKP